MRIALLLLLRVARNSYLQQEPELDDDATVEENVLAGVAPALKLLSAHTAATAEGRTEDAAALKAEIDALGAWGIDKRIYRAMRALNCPPPDALVAPLSGLFTTLFIMIIF